MRMIMGEPRGGAPSWASFLEEVVLEVRGRVKDKEKEGKPGDSEVTFDRGRWWRAHIP